MNKYAVIVAAGSGTRMGKEIPKQFLPLAGKPLLFHTLSTFAAAFSDLRIILVMHPAYLDRAAELISLTGHPSAITLVPGADTRFNSVKAGLDLVPADSIVFVHDGVRCLLTA